MAEATVPAKTKQDKEISATRESGRYLVPPVDIYETKEKLVVVADLPGVRKDALDINVENGILTFKGYPTYKVRGIPVDEEFGMVNYYRQFTLSDEIDHEKIRADLKNGVLTLDLPKAEKAKPKKIEVIVS